MREQLISFETAKLAKEKGFEGYCFSYYNLKGDIKHNYLENGSSTDIEFRVDLEDLLDNWNRDIPNTYSAPTQSLLQKWLREVHNIHIELTCFTDNTWDGLLIYENAPYKWDDKTAPVEAENCKTYEEALEICLQKALKLI